MPSNSEKVTISEPWYALLEERYGLNYCQKAGYFEETGPFVGSYRAVFDLPRDQTVIQFSGAFYPFHEGHLSIIRDAVRFFEGYHKIPFIVLHADHAEYRQSKGIYDEEAFMSSFDLMSQLSCRWMLVREDEMPAGCSRNFTRLYSELLLNANEVWFLSGGDRANYALTFRDNGRCIIAGRENDPMYRRYHYLGQTPHLVFLPGNNPTSSTVIRAGQ